MRNPYNRTLITITVLVWSILLQQSSLFADQALTGTEVEEVTTIEYIPIVETSSNIEIATWSRNDDSPQAEETSSNVDSWDKDQPIDSYSAESRGKEPIVTWTYLWWITMTMADINYTSTQNGDIIGTCSGEWYCMIVHDNNGSVGRYINIDQSDMISETTRVWDEKIYMRNDIETPSRVYRHGSTEVIAIPTNGDINFDSDVWHTILSKKRADGITWSYGVNPLFHIDADNLQSWLYSWETTITLYIN